MVLLSISLLFVFGIFGRIFSIFCIFFLLKGLATIFGRVLITFSLLLFVSIVPIR